MKNLLLATVVAGFFVAGQAQGALDTFETYSPGNIDLLNNGDMYYDFDEASSNGTATVVNNPAYAYEGSQYMNINEPGGGRDYLDVTLGDDISIDGGRVQFAYRREATTYSGFNFVVYGRDGANNQATSHGIYLSYNGELGLWVNGITSLVYPGGGSGPFIMATDRWYLFTLDHTQSPGGLVSFTLNIEDTSDNSVIANVGGNGLTSASKTLFGLQHFRTDATGANIHNIDAYYVGPVPEPSSLALLLVGSLFGLRRRG